MFHRRWPLAATAVLLSSLLLGSSAQASPATESAQADQVAALFDTPIDASRVSTAADAAPAVATHRVVAGDTLWQLAASSCGNAKLYPNLAAGNAIANPDRIYVGQLLRLTCGHTSSASRSSTRTPAPPVATSDRAQVVIRFALAQVGKQYRWGSAGPNTYDCSGLVMAAYARIGIRLPHQSGAMLAYGRHVSRSQLRPGDLVWPYSGHVMIYLGGGKVVEAANPRDDIQVNNLYAFWTARRLV